MDDPNNLFMADLRARYLAGVTTPREVVSALLDRIHAGDEHHVWITRLSRAAVMAHVDALDPGAVAKLPLYGIPFAVKDNIDLAGVPTTAACPAYAYTAPESATVVRRLIEAGAIPMGKTNLDQFATGLVGARSPYGACRNSLRPEYISGGSSSGSAVAVALGLASFALGTDTAGSGRVPAAFNNLIGLKPSNGRLSTRGVVPACRSLDCISIFALTADDAATVLDVAQGYDAADPYSRDPGDRALAAFRVGVPRPDQLQFFGDTEYARLFGAASHRVQALGGSLVEVDFEPFLAAARLLYQGPWVAERYAAVGEFVRAHPDSVHPVTRGIIAAGAEPSAVAAFQAIYRLKELERRTASAWSQADLLLTPTAGTIYRLSEIDAEPVELNTNLGCYTNFMNLFDLCGVAVPAGFRADGLPFGVTLVGPRGTERGLLRLAGRLQRSSVDTVGALAWRVPAQAPPARSLPAGYVTMAVCGAHMQGLPLNQQLRERGAYLIHCGATAAHYRLLALPGGPPHRPGMIRVPADGAAIELEVWALPTAEVGSFIAGIPAPLGVGKVELDTGEWVTGFICEGYAADAATDITRYGGWRAYIKAAFV